MDDMREELVYLRDRLRALIEVEEDGTKLAALSREHRQVLGELSKMKPPSTESKVDELAKRRADRSPEAADSASTGRRGQPRRSGRVH